MTSFIRLFCFIDVFVKGVFVAALFSDTLSYGARMDLYLIFTFDTMLLSILMT